MNKLIYYVLFILVLLGLTSCETSETSEQYPVNTSDKIVCDVTQYANISSKELVALLGNPDNISVTTPSTGFVEIPCTYYDYYNAEELGEVSFLLINDTVAKFTAYNDFPFYSKNKILSSLNVEKSENCAIVADTETAIRLRCLTDSIDDLWITNIEGDTYGFLAVTYDMMYFEEWYLPMSISEQSDYQYWTIEYVKSLLKSPKSADFPTIVNWTIVKNNFYIAVQSYVDAVNSFGAEIRSDFTFIYPRDVSIPVCVVFDDEIIVDDGYIPTADLVKQLVEEIANQTSVQTEKQESTGKLSSLIDETIPEPVTSTQVQIPPPETTIETTIETPPETTPVETIPEPVQIEITEPIEETNSISDLEYVVYNVCEEYNSGETPYNGQLYGTVNSATSVTIEHYIRDLIPESEENKLYQMEDTLLNIFSSTLSDVFPESIEIIVYTTATIIDDSLESSGWDDELISDADLQSIYNLTVLWLDTEILIMPEGLAVTSYQIIVDKKNLQATGSCEGSYNGNTITLIYDDTLYFYYDDLVAAGII